MRYSASQINTFRECRRKWAFDKIDRLPREPNPSADLGTRVHQIAEAWLKDATPPDEHETFAYVKNGRPQIRHPGRIFVSGLHLNPEPSPYHKLEERFVIEPGILGYIDLQYDDVVQDHKTSSNPARYGLTYEDMITDPQCVIYARKKLLEGHEAVRLRWVYYPTTPPYAGAYAVERTVTLEDIAPAWEGILETCAEIVEARKEKRALDLAPSWDACNNYGGCPHRAACQEGREMDPELAALLGQIHNDDAPPPPIPSGDTPPPISSGDTPPPIPTETVRHHADGTKEPLPPIPVTDQVPRRPKANGKDLESIAALSGHMDPSAISIELGLAVSEVKRVLATMTDPINPPEAPEPGGEGPVQEDPPPAEPTGDRSAWDRAEWKQYCLARGYVDTSCRYGLERLRDLVAEKEATPPPVPETKEDIGPQHEGRGLGDLTSTEIALIKAFREVVQGG